MVKDLRSLGFDIIFDKSEKNNGGYYINSHEFTEGEINILLDCLTASKCISTRKTREIAEKLCNTNSEYTKYYLSKHVYIDNRSKTQNDNVYEYINAINSAIKENKKISFNYCDYDESKKLIAKLDKDGMEKVYVANPIGMVLKDDYYYIILNMDKYDSISNYRIDKMKNVIVLDEDQKSRNNIKEIRERTFDDKDIGNYARKSIKMFLGKEQLVELEVNAVILSFIISELGEDSISVNKIEENLYNVKFKCMYGPGLVKWVIQFSTGAKVIYPKQLKEDMLEELQKIISIY